MEMRVKLTTIISLNDFLICIIHKCAKLSTKLLFFLFLKMINESNICNSKETNSVHLSLRSFLLSVRRWKLY